jgi:prevent-host-death family protein
MAKEGVGMCTVGIRDLKNHLTAYLRRTRKGEQQIVTDRGKPIALIQPIQSATQPVSLEARLAKLAAEGLISLSDGRRLKKFKPAKVSGKPSSQLILEDCR